MTKNYDKAFQYMAEVGRDNVSNRLAQLLTFHTIFWVKLNHKDNQYVSEDISILDNMIGAELLENKNGNISNPSYDGGKQYDIDFFTDNFIIPNRKGITIESKPEWGQEIIVEKPKVPATTPLSNSSKTTNPDICNLISILDYKNGAQITKMLNKENPAMTKHKPYDKVPKADAIEIMKSLAPVIVKDRKKLVTSFLSREGINGFN